MRILLANLLLIIILIGITGIPFIPDDTPDLILLTSALKVTIACLTIAYCSYALLLSVYYVESPRERVQWAILTTFCNIIGAYLYYTLKHGKGNSMEVHSKGQTRNSNIK